MLASMDKESLLEKINAAHPDGLLPSGTMVCDAGQIVFRQGAPANQAFYVADGLLEVLMEEDGRSVKLAEIGTGEIFGEMGVLSRESRLATVKAVAKSTVIIMTREEILQRIDNIQDPVVTALIEDFTRRLRAASIAQARYYKNLAAFQERVAGLMDKADQGIAPEKREAFSLEIAPLLAQIEATLEKYKS